jgi:hypothetical protein
MGVKLSVSEIPLDKAGIDFIFDKEVVREDI